MSKTRKPKMVDGYLCRDKMRDEAGIGLRGTIVFFHGGDDPPYKVGFGWDGLWPLKEWTLREWKKDYDLTPPRPGRKFEVSLEL